MRRVLLFQTSPRSTTLPPVWWSLLTWSSDRLSFAPGGAYLGVRIAVDDDVVIERSASVWPFSRSANQRNGSITLLNGDGELNTWIPKSWRGSLYELRWCWESEARDPAYTWAQCRIWQTGRIDALTTSEGGKRLTFLLADPLARLDRPINRAIYPDDAPNEAIRNTPMPITLGTVRFAPGVLRSTALTGDDAFSFDYHDAPIAAVTAAFDRGDVFTLGTDWSYIPGRTGIKLVNKPDNPVTAHLSGAMLATAAATTWNFVSGTWTLGVPDGWALTKSGAATLSKVAGGARFLAPSGSLYITSTTAVLAADTDYQITVEASAVASGLLYASIPTFLILSIDRPATWSSRIPAVGYARQLRLWMPNPPAGVTISRVTITPVTLTDRLPAFMGWLLARAGVGPGDIDSTAINALDAATTYQLGYYGDDNKTTLALLRAALDSFGGWVTATRAGAVTVGRLVARGSTPAAATLGRESIITARWLDEDCAGLSVFLGGRRNHRVHGPSEIAGSVIPADAADLQAEYTIKNGRLGSPVLSPNARYEDAARADVFPTLLQDADQLAAEARRMVALFAFSDSDDKLYRWLEMDVAMQSDAIEALQIGDWVHVTHTIQGLAAGRHLRLMGYTLRFRSRRATLLLLNMPED